jgi:anti-anti-sigma factor
MFFINHTDIGDGSAAIIEVEGPLNSDSTPDFDDYIVKLMNNNVIYLLLDMQNLTYISSEGIGATLMIQKSLNEKNGLAVFFNLNYEITSLFKLLGFDTIFTIADDRASALHILDKRMELSPPAKTAGNFDDMENEELSFPEDRYSPSDAGISGTDDFEISDDFSVIEDNEEEEKNTFESFVIECIKCNSLIRVKESGDQLCPYCSAEFTVNDGKKAVFKMKDIHS